MIIRLGQCTRHQRNTNFNTRYNNNQTLGLPKRDTKCKHPKRSKRRTDGLQNRGHNRGHATRPEISIRFLNHVMDSRGQRGNRRALPGHLR